MTAPATPDPAHRARRAAASLLIFLPVVLAVVPPETRGEGALACAAVAALALAAHRLGRGGLPSAAPLCIVAIVGWPLVVAAGAPGSPLGRLALLAAALGLGGAAAALVPELRSSRAAPWAIAVAGTIPAVHGLWQVAFGLRATAAALDPALAAAHGGEIAARIEAGRAFAAFPTPAALGGWCAMTLPVTVALGWTRTGPARTAAWILAAVQAAGLLATRSVTAAAALGAAVLLAALARKLDRRAIAGLLALAAVVVAAAVATRGTEILDPDHPTHPLHLRLRNARATIAMIVDRPWAGVGLGGYPDAYPVYRQAGDNETRYAHDLPLQTVAELGIPVGVPAALAFLWLFLGPLARRSRSVDPIETGLALGLASFALHNLADFTAYLPSFVIAASILRGAVARPAEPAVEVGAGRTVRALAVLATVAGLAFLAADGLARDARWRSQWLALAGEHQASERSARSAARIAPWSVDGVLRHAEASMVTDPKSSEPSAWAAPLAIAERAVELAPRSGPARRVRSALRERTGDLPGAWIDAEIAAAILVTEPDAASDRDRLAARVGASIAR